ncbi:MAG: nucleotidyltransferase, partial [Lachnospiraceae bacterium]|nr:nucleotidyltransferase [Lachnospiraceae bacterium]
FSIYDAKQAGFETVVFIIKKEMEQDFRECVGDPISKHMEVKYVFQELTNVPADFTIPEGRVKPWGTTHALMCCKDVLDGPFMVINADDYYGKNGYKLLYDFLTTTEDDEKCRYAMVGYELGKTLTDKGSVTRGVCERDDDSFLTGIVEQKMIVKTEDGAAYSNDEGATFIPIDVKTPVSMNMWGFGASVMPAFEKALNNFFANEVAKNPMKAECLIPTEVDVLLKEDVATVKVLTSSDQWFGVTYKEDKPYVVESIKKLKDAGEYPEYLWK